jgi:hypothetical protein
MSFNLYENPFAVLGLGLDASSAEISLRTRELGGDAASLASRTLISPRSRLQAEVTFLPGLSRQEVTAVLSSLSGGKVPAFSEFTSLARANILAHLASSGKATAANLSMLAATAPIARENALEVLNRDRHTAAMPPISGGMFESAMEQLATLHAEALSDGACVLPNGGGLLAEMVDGLKPSDAEQCLFLRQTMSAWDRATASDANKDLDRAHELEATLRATSDQATLAELSALVSKVAARMRPSRSLAQRFGLPHDASAEIVNAWRCLAVDLVKQHTALTQAETLLEALAREFGTSDEPGQRVARDLANCRERIASGEDLPEAKRFAAALEAAKKNPAIFKGDVLTSVRFAGHGRNRGPAVACELWDAFSPTESQNAQTV